MKFSCVLFCALAFVSCIFVSSRFLFFYFLFCIPCIQFIANLSVNSLQILVRSYLSSELRGQVFSLWWTRLHRFVIFGPTGNFPYHRSLHLGATDFTTGKTVCHLFCVSSDPAPLNESCPLQASHLYKCFVLWLKDQTLLGNWCQRGRERSHQSLSFRERSHQRKSLSPP